MGYLVGILGLEGRVPFERGLLGHDRRDAPYTRPEHLRLALEELGAAFVKIGQAHAATLHDGTEVVVKIRRPGVVEQVEEDLEILQNLVVRAGRRWQMAADYDLVALAEEFGQTLRAELDYLREGRSAEGFAANFTDDPDVHISRVFWGTTTSRVLTLERIRGIKVSDFESLDAAGIDRHGLAERATRVTAKMIGARADRSRRSRLRPAHRRRARPRRRQHPRRPKIAAERPR